MSKWSPYVVQRPPGQSHRLSTGDSFAKLGEEVGFRMDVEFDVKFELGDQEFQGPASIILSPGRGRRAGTASLGIVRGFGGDLNVAVDLVSGSGFLN